MRKLTAAGILAAGSLGLSLQATAATTVYDIDGEFGRTEHSCTQITFALGGADCTYGRNRVAASGGWVGPLFGGGHYAQDGVKDQVTYTPTFGLYDANTDTFAPAADDGKISPPISGSLTIDDNNTPSDPTDDLISTTFSIGQVARNVSTGQSTRAVQRWTTMTHTVAPTAVNPTATVANGEGGFDYVIGSRGFPTVLCSATDSNDCIPTPNSSNNATADYNLAEVAVSFWTVQTAGSIGIERSGLIGDPNFTLVQPPPATPTGNLGAVSTATFTGLSCSTNNLSADDCTVSPLIWGAGEDAGFDNLIMKISTNSAGAITSAQVFYTQEYFIGAFGAPANYDNSWQGGRFTFTGLQQNLSPNARDFEASVLENSTTNTLDTVTNSVNFGGDVTVTIITPPGAGTATVNGNNTINYNATGASPGTQTIVYEATDGDDTDQGTITVTVEADTSPVAADGTLTISTQGAAPGAATAGTVNVTTLAGYVAGNGTNTASLSAPTPANGTASISAVTSVRFTPAADFFAGTDQVGYTVTDGDGDSDTGVITVTIADVDPVLADGTITTEQDTNSSALALGITPGNGSVAQHTLAVTTAATSGTCSISGTSVTYAPNADFAGTDSCVVTLTDGNGDSDTGTISVTVNEVDDSIKLPGGGSAVDLWSLALLGALPLLRRRRA